MKLHRPKTTLFMLMSVDGKISTGQGNTRDFDKDLPNIQGVQNGLYQYYDIEKTTDVVSLNTGKVMAKIGVNKKDTPVKPVPCSFVIVDNKPHLTKQGIIHLSKKLKHLYLVTTNKKHPAYFAKKDNVTVLYSPKTIHFPSLFEKLYGEHGIKKLTVQSGGTLNAILIKAGLIDRVSIVVAPCLVGGDETPTLVDGRSVLRDGELKNIRGLALDKVFKLKHSYLHLRYRVLNNQ